jgi:glycosyltransferase involved in cell wall biosynthesis
MRESFPRPVRVLILLESGFVTPYWARAPLLLQESGFDVTVVTVREPGPLNAQLRAHGCGALALNCGGANDYPLAAVRLARLVQDNEIDVIHACEPIAAVIGGTAGLLARRGLRVFHRQHSLARGRQALLSRFGSRLAQLTIACSAAAAEYATSSDRVPLSRIRIAHNSVPDLREVTDAEIAALRREMELPADALVIVSVARLRPEKGHDALIEALPLVAASIDRRTHLVIVGSGPQERALRDRAATVAPGLVRFAGHQEDVAPWYALGTVVAIPSYWDAFPLAGVEAMAASRPVVASRVGGLSEMLEDGSSGLLVPPGDSRALAAAVVGLMRSPARRADIGAAARRRFLDSFTMPAMIEKWATFYHEMLSTQPEGVR